ncbi:Hint domain-containing protein, partial [Leptospira santarosai]
AWDGVKGAFGNNDASESLCFVSGTLVLTGTGLKPIEKVKIGDEVLAFNPETKDQSLKRVVRLFKNENAELLKIKFGDGEEVVTTPGHRFFTETRGFVLAGDLTKEDLFFDKAGEKISIHSIVKETHKEKIPVFNFEVEEYHTYYVGETCILVHNDSVKMLQERVGAGEKPGFFSGLGEKLTNLVSGNGFNTNASLNSGPVKIVSGTGGGKPGSEIIEDSNGKLYQRQTNRGKTEWVEVNPATMNPQRHAEGQALMAQGAANNDLAAYSKGLAMTKGYGWNDNGLNMVGIRVPVDSQNAIHDDYMLAINKGKLEGVYFASTQPGQKSYNGSAALGGVGEISTGHRTIVIDDRRNGPDSWKNATLGRSEDGKMTGARDANADGNHSPTERAISALTNIGGVFFHQGSQDRVDIIKPSRSKDNTLVVDYVKGKVDNYSQGCQITNMSYYHDAQSGTNKIFQPGDINKATGNHGAYSSVENLIRNNPKFGYSLINSSDYSEGLMNHLNDLRTNAREEFMQQALDKFKSDNPRYKNHDVQFNR